MTAKNPKMQCSTTSAATQRTKTAYSGCMYGGGASKRSPQVYTHIHNFSLPFSKGQIISCEEVQVEDLEAEMQKHVVASTSRISGK